MENNKIEEKTIQQNEIKNQEYKIIEKNVINNNINKLPESENLSKIEEKKRRRKFNGAR